MLQQPPYWLVIPTTRAEVYGVVLSLADNDLQPERDCPNGVTAEGMQFGETHRRKLGAGLGLFA